MRIILIASILIVVTSCKTKQCEFDMLELWSKGSQAERGKVALCLKRDNSLIRNKARSEVIGFLGPEEGSGSSNGKEYISYKVDIGTDYAHDFRIYFNSTSRVVSDLLILD